MNKKLEALNTEEISDVSGGYVAPIFIKNKKNGTRRIGRWEIFYDEDGNGHKAGDHAGFASTIRKAFSLDQKINPHRHHHFGPPPGHHGPGRRGKGACQSCKRPLGPPPKF